jgi:hypothetical protein
MRGERKCLGEEGGTFFKLDINFNEEEKTRQEIPLFKKGVSQSVSQRDPISPLLYIVQVSDI